MKLRLVWVGRTRERSLIEGIHRYQLLLRAFAHVSIVEVPDCRGRDRAKAVEEEGRRILRLGEPYLLLDERGRQLSSPEFADFIGSRGAHTFVIGGAFGVSEAVRQGALDTIALSKMTLTHEMARLVLIEQLYRAMTILRGMEYHH